MEDWEGFVWWMTRGGFYRSQMGKSSLSVPNTLKKNVDSRICILKVREEHILSQFFLI